LLQYSGDKEYSAVVSQWDATTLATTPVNTIFERFKKKLGHRAMKEKAEIVDVVHRHATAKMVTFWLI
jgi:hypothetical protein